MTENAETAFAAVETPPVVGAPIPGAPGHEPPMPPFLIRKPAPTQPPATLPELQGHPIAEVLPLMDGTAFEDLVKDIELHGQRDTVTIHEGMILDGRNRYRACRMLGIECRAEEWDGKGSPVAFVFSKNLRRRDLHAGQRAMVVARLATLQPGDVKAQKAGPSQDGPILSTAEAAALANVSTATIERAKTVLAEGTAEEIEAVKSGAEKVKPVAPRIRARRSKVARKVTKAEPDTATAPAHEAAAEPVTEAVSSTGPAVEQQVAERSAEVQPDPEPAEAESQDETVDQAAEKEMDDLIAAWDGFKQLWDLASVESQRDLKQFRGFELKKLGIRIERQRPSQSRQARWSEAVAELLEIQQECSDWLESLPENLKESATGEALQAIMYLDLSELESVEPPLGFGRD